MMPAVLAQSAANFDTKVLTPDGTAAVKDEKPASVAKEPAPSATTPSRFVGPSELPAYLEGQSSVFLARGRARDPFAQMQDPDAKPVVRVTKTANKPRQSSTQVTPFSEIIRLIDVKVVMPKEQKFLLGNRQFGLGDIVPLRFRGKPLRAEVTEINARSINFRNSDTGETGTRTLDVLPAGMTPGSDGITAPGMTRDSNDAPIDLDAPMDSGMTQTSESR